MKNDIITQIASLRDEMKEAGIQAWYLSGTDPHLSEYLPDYWQVRKFISGFNGSFGFMVVTLTEAALWTDSRYFLQAEEQLDGTGIQLMKFRMQGTPTPAKWLSGLLDANEHVGTSAACFSIKQFTQLQKELAASELQLVDCGDLMEQVWTNRPELPKAPIFEHELKYAGRSRTEKLDLIREDMQSEKANYILLSALDDIAWTFNLRGNDVGFNPIFMAYALVGESETTLFVDTDKLPAELTQKLEQDHIFIQPYEAVFTTLQALKGDIVLDPDRVNYALLEALPKSVKVVYKLSIAQHLKAIKTDHEIEMFKIAMRKDGVAMVKFFKWLYSAAGNESFDEYDVLTKLAEFRSQQEGYMGESFYSIVGYKGNGAVVHRSVTKDEASPIDADGILLLDSGGQYLEGSTDITRTVTLGNPTKMEKEDFTIALKGTIGMVELKFPVNTPGCNLDLAARHAMWQTGRNYGHGTCHGIGFFLNVHEGPMSIRQEYNDRVIEAGMVMSDEPAFYRKGEYGIRTENVMVCKEWQSNEFGDFLQFETITLCPIDTNLIEKELLTKQEVAWINTYHQQCYEQLSPYLNAEETSFLAEKTKAI